MEGPAWLSRAPLPFDKACIREVIDDSYCRDRYAPITAKELRAWHKREWEERQLRTSTTARESFQKFMGHVAKADPNDVYLLCWYEWESGMR